MSLQVTGLLRLTAAVNGAGGAALPAPHRAAPIPTAGAAVGGAGGAVLLPITKLISAGAGRLYAAAISRAEFLPPADPTQAAAAIRTAELLMALRLTSRETGAAGGFAALRCAAGAVGGAGGAVLAMLVQAALITAAAPTVSGATPARLRLLAKLIPASRP